MTEKLKQVPNYFDSLLHDILITIEKKGGGNREGGEGTEDKRRNKTNERNNERQTKRGRE